MNVDLTVEDIAQRLLDLQLPLKECIAQLGVLLRSAQSDQRKKAKSALRALLRAKHRIRFADLYLPILVAVRGGAVHCLGSHHVTATLLCYHRVESLLQHIEDVCGGHVAVYGPHTSVDGVNSTDLCVLIRDEMSNGEWGVDPFSELMYLSMEILFEQYQALILAQTDLAKANALMQQGPRSVLLQVPQKPSWNKRDGALSFRGLICRNVNTSRANNIVLILDQFSELNWPTQIASPLRNGRDPQKLGDAVKQLNKGLKYLKFSRTGTGKHIQWIPVE